jgi:hypothetical protein
VSDFPIGRPDPPLPSYDGPSPHARALPVAVRETRDPRGTTTRASLRTTVSMAAVRESAAPKARPRAVLLPLVAIVLLGAWAARVLRPAPVAQVPLVMQGTWVTDDPRYAGRTLELLDSTVTVVHPEGSESSTVRGVEVQSRGDTLSVVIRHGDEGALQELSLGFVASPEAHLVLRHPEAVRWVRPAAPGGA